MDVRALIASYVDDVTRRLPAAKQADVALELTALLHEDLAARAAASGRPADEAMALALLRGFGRPAEVAERYHPGFALIGAGDTRDFLVLAVAGALGFVALGQLTLQSPPRDWASATVLEWLGLLALVFGARSWTRYRWPSLGQWRPHDVDKVSRGGHAALVGVILLGIVCYGAPTWVFATLTGGKVLTPALAYDADFQTWRLPWILGVWAVTAVFLTWTAIEGRWRPLTRRIEAGLGLAMTLALAWYLVGGPIFRSPALDHSAKIGVVIAIAIMLVDLTLKVRRIRRAPPPALAWTSPG